MGTPDQVRGQARGASALLQAMAPYQPESPGQRMQEGYDWARFKGCLAAMSELLGLDELLAFLAAVPTV
jgi:hypothetical protein